MKKVAICCLFILILSGLNVHVSQAGSKHTVNIAAERSMRAAAVWRQVTDSPQASIPRNILDHAAVVAVFPLAYKYGFAVGGEGYGVASIRETSSQQWSAPIFLKIGHRYKKYPGGENVDIIMVGLTPRAASLFFQDEFDIGKEMARQGISLATGPVEDLSRNEEDYQQSMQHDLLIYACVAGRFSGAVINQAKVWQDDNLNDATYGKDEIENFRPVSESAPAGLMDFTDALEDYFENRGV